MNSIVNRATRHIFRCQNSHAVQVSGKKFPGMWVMALSISLCAALAPTGVQAAPQQNASPQITDRIAGKTRYETAFLASAKQGAGAAELYLVSGKSQVDGVTSGSAPGPVIYVDHFSSSLSPQAIRQQIDSLAPKKLVLLGGENTLTQAEFDTIAAGYPAQRIAGQTRIQTAIEFSRYKYPQGSKRVYLVNQGDSQGVSPDAAPAATLEGGPILLSATPQLADETVSEIERLSPEEVIIIGGSSVLAPQIESQLDALEGVKHARWEGKDRLDTALNVAFHRGETQPTKHIYVARADRPVDAVAAGAVTDGPLLYIPPNTSLNNAHINLFSQQTGVTSVIPVGGVAGSGFVFHDPQLLEPPRHVEIPVPFISQIWPYYAWVGCEPTALLMGLQGKGYASGVNLRTFLDRMPKSASNPATGFVGSPYRPSEVLRTTIYPKALSEYGKRYGDVRDMTGASMDEVANTIRRGNPVVVYLTLYYRPAYYRWFNIDGHRELLLRNNHAVLLTGYDADTRQFQVADPYNRTGQNPYIYWKPRSVIEPLYNLRHHALGVF